MVQAEVAAVASIDISFVLRSTCNQIQYLALQDFQSTACEGGSTWSGRGPQSASGLALMAPFFLVCLGEDSIKELTVWLQGSHRFARKGGISWSNRGPRRLTQLVRLFCSTRFLASCWSGGEPQSPQSRYNSINYFWAVQEPTCY